MRRGSRPLPGPRTASCAFCGASPHLCPTLRPRCSDVWRDPEVTPVAAAVLTRAGRTLLCQRAGPKRHGGLWEFPGGKLLPEETLGEALRRELAEELGLALSALGAWLGSRRDPGSPFEIHFVECRAEGDPLTLEHEALAWVTREELLSYALAPGDRAFAEAWLEGGG